jgi:hypothetical protein
MTIQGRPSSSTTSKTVTTPGWLNLAAVLASRSVRWYSELLSAGLSVGGTLTSLTATSRSRSSSRPRQTVPMAPRPIGSRSR